jgi:hypothetical protein
MIEIESQSKRDKFSSLLTFASFLGILLALLLCFTNRLAFGIPALVIFLYIFKVSVSWFFNLKRHFEFDGETGVVNQITLNKSEKSIKQIATSEEIETFAVNGIKNSSKTTKESWTYQILMILKNGNIIKITNPEAKEQMEILKKAYELASVMNCKCFNCLPQHTIVVKKTSDGIEIIKRPWQLIDTFRWQGLDIIYSLSFLLFLSIFLVITIFLLF